jgi:adenylate cyclase
VSHSDTDDLFREAEVRAEFVLGSVRMFVAIVLGSVLAAAMVNGSMPHDRSTSHQFGLAGATIGGYFIVGALSAFLARPHLHRAWYAWAYATCDVVVVLASLYASMTNMALPSNFIAGLPSAWLVPLVLTFGGLRFNPVQQAYVTVLLILGVVTIVATATPWSDLGDDMATAGLAFFFSGAPNVMRLLMVTLAGVVITLSALRARNLLRRAVTEARQRLNVTRYLPRELAGQLAEANVAALREGQRQRVTVMFVDIRGFTAQTESMNPSEMGEFVSQFRSRITSAAGRHGGVIDKFIGDAAMLVFGVTRESSDDARNALDCAYHILDNVDAWNTERQARGEPAVAVGIGIHCGEVFCGAVGDESRLEFTVLGDTVNVAARLENLSKTEAVRIVASRDLLDAAHEDPQGPDWRLLESHHVRGRHAAIELFASNRT